MKDEKYAKLQQRRISLGRQLYDTPLGREYVLACIEEFGLLLPTDTASKELTEEIRQRKDIFRDLLFCGRETTQSILEYLYGYRTNRK